jgi:hypothetical protein
MFFKFVTYMIRIRYITSVLLKVNNCGSPCGRTVLDHLHTAVAGSNPVHGMWMFLHVSLLSVSGRGQPTAGGPILSGFGGKLTTPSLKKLVCYETLQNSHSKEGTWIDGV